MDISKRYAAKVMSDDAIRAKIRRMAKLAGATLANDGKGGLPAATALAVFKRDRWKCTNKHCPAPKKNITLDHISGHADEIEADPEARNRDDLQEGIELGHVDKPEALHVLCAACHDRVHEREREIQDGDKPEPMRGE